MFVNLKSLPGLTVFSGYLEAVCVSRAKDNFYKALFVSSCDIKTYLELSQDPKDKDCL